MSLSTRRFSTSVRQAVQRLCSSLLLASLVASMLLLPGLPLTAQALENDVRYPATLELLGLVRELGGVLPPRLHRDLLGAFDLPQRGLRHGTGGAVRKEEVACVPRLDVDDVADVPEVLAVLEQQDREGAALARHGG